MGSVPFVPVVPRFPWEGSSLLSAVFEGGPLLAVPPVLPLLPVGPLPPLPEVVALAVGPSVGPPPPTYH
jgi:hypothetical protein